MKKSIWLILAAVVALVGVKASAQTANGGDLLSITEVNSTLLQVTYDGTPVQVTMIAPDEWTFANPFPDTSVPLFPFLSPALWKEPEWSSSMYNPWNGVALNGDSISVVSDISGDFGMSYMFNDGAIHELGQYDGAFDGTPGGGGPGTLNITFRDLGDTTPTGVPDGGMTAMLLGMGVAGVAWLRRRFVA
jgi:hypothetical protein